MNQHIGDFISRLKQIGVNKTVITSNASLLTMEMAENLILAGLDEIKISFDGESPEKNGSLRINGYFQKDAQNVKNLLKMRNQLQLINPSINIFNTRILHHSEALQYMGR
jgi:MoaA/NifB/PqqE/SkfB family radical SAM enzyme